MGFSLHGFERELRRISAGAMLPLRRELFIGEEKGEERHWIDSSMSIGLLLYLFLWSNSF